MFEFIVAWAVTNGILACIACDLAKIAKELRIRNQRKDNHGSR